MTEAEVDGRAVEVVGIDLFPPLFHFRQIHSRHYFRRTSVLAKFTSRHFRDGGHSTWSRESYSKLPKVKVPSQKTEESVVSS